MLILGIDPGLHLTGYGLVSLAAARPVLKEAGVLRIKPPAAARSETDNLPTRLHELFVAVTEIITETSPTHIAVEQLYAHYKHPRTAILMGHARGVILLAAAQHQIPVTSLASTLVKKSVSGNGHASKLQIQRSIASLCRLKTLPQPPDVADAIAIAWTLATRLSRTGASR